MAIVVALRNRIQLLDKNEKLPSVTTLAHNYGVTMTTVSRAVKVLENEGIIYRRPGRGVFVR